MSITIAFGRWGLPYLVSVGRWEWTCYRATDYAPRAARRWGVDERCIGKTVWAELGISADDIGRTADFP